MDIEKSINDLYGGKLRIRVCGFCINNQKILLLNHASKNGDLWIPPGGGLEYGETIEDALKREFIEETNLKIDLDNFLFITEFIDLPLHAVELFYLVKITSGIEKLGKDPESPNHSQLLQDLKWFSIDEIKNIPVEQKHEAIKDKKLKILEQFLSK